MAPRTERRTNCQVFIPPIGSESGPEGLDGFVSLCSCIDLLFSLYFYFLVTGVLPGTLPVLAIWFCANGHVVLWESLFLVERRYRRFGKRVAICRYEGMFSV